MEWEHSSFKPDLTQIPCIGRNPRNACSDDCPCYGHVRVRLFACTKIRKFVDAPLKQWFCRLERYGFTTIKGAATAMPFHMLRNAYLRLCLRNLHVFFSLPTRNAVVLSWVYGRIKQCDHSRTY